MNESTLPAAETAVTAPANSERWTQVSWKALLAIVVGAAVLGLLAGFGCGTYLSRRRGAPTSAIAEAPPKYIPSDNAIARFGLAPVNPDWVQVTHRSGQAIDGVPAPEWAVFTFFYEPKVEKIEQPDGEAVWKVTFE